MKKYIVNRVFINYEAGKLEKYYWGTWTDYNRANEVALELREDLPRGWSTEVVTVEGDE